MCWDYVVDVRLARVQLCVCMIWRCARHMCDHRLTRWRHMWTHCSRTNRAARPAGTGWVGFDRDMGATRALAADSAGAAMDATAAAMQEVEQSMRDPLRKFCLWRRVRRTLQGRAACRPAPHPQFACGRCGLTLVASGGWLRVSL